MLVSNEGCVECKSLGINYLDSEGINEQTLLGQKYNIIDGDELLTTEVSTDLISDSIRVDNCGRKSDGFPVGASDDATLGFSDSSILGVADSSKVNIPCLALMNAVKNAVHLSHVNDILKEPRGDLYLD